VYVETKKNTTKERIQKEKKNTSTCTSVGHELVDPRSIAVRCWFVEKPCHVCYNASCVFGYEKSKNGCDICHQCAQPCKVNGQTCLVIVDLTNNPHVPLFDHQGTHILLVSYCCFTVLQSVFIHCNFFAIILLTAVLFDFLRMVANKRYVFSQMISFVILFCSRFVHIIN